MVRALRSPINPETIQANRSQRAFWLGLLAVLAMGACYIAFPVANFTDAKDSLSYADRIGKGMPHFHPNHLLYEPIIYVVHSAVKLLRPDTDTLTTMRWVSIACALPFLILCYLIIWRAHHRVLIAVLGTGAVAFSFGVWVYAVSPDGYLPPLLFALLTLVLLDPTGWGTVSGGPSLGRIFVAALTMACAVLFHQLYVVFAVILGGVMLAAPAYGPLPRRLRNFVLFGAVSGSVTFAAYLWAYLTLAPSDPLLVWSRGYARETLYFGDAPSFFTPLKGGVGAISTMLTMNGLMAFDGIADRLTQAFPTKSLLEERYIAQMGIPGLLRVPVLIAMLGALLAWLTMMVLAIRDMSRSDRQYVNTVLLVSVLMYTLLVLIWEPTNREFWIQTYVFATVWCACQIWRVDRVRIVSMVALVLCLFFVNFTAALRPLATATTDYWKRYNRDVLESSEHVDIVVTSCSWLCEWYLRYFTDALIVSPVRQSPAVLHSLITTAAATGSGTILVSSLAYTPHPLYPHQKHILSADQIQGFTALYPPPHEVSLPDPMDGQIFFEVRDGAVVPWAPATR